MNPGFQCKSINGTILLLLLCSFAVGRASSSVAGRAMPAADRPQAIPQSVFTVPHSSGDGCNPFFPRSKVVTEAPKPDQVRQLDPAELVLNGISNAAKPTAMFNGKTFEVGEEGEVKLKNGSRIRIRCLEIKSDSAIIEVNGVRTELRLPLGL